MKKELERELRYLIRSFEEDPETCSHLIFKRMLKQVQEYSYLDKVDHIKAVRYAFGVDLHTAIKLVDIYRS